MTKSVSIRLISLFLAVLTFSLQLVSCGRRGGADETAGAGGDAGDPPLVDTEPVVDDDADKLSGIVIRSAEELAKVGSGGDYPLDGDYYLVVDIDLSGVNWTPIGGADGVSGDYTAKGTFTGTFDGRGHTIRGLTIDQTTTVETYWGLFGSVGSSKNDDPAVIRNIVFANVDISVSTSGNWTGVGTLAGQVNGSAVIESIAILSGAVVSVSPDAMNIGVGSLYGQSRTQEGLPLTNQSVKVRNIFSDVDVSSMNSGIDMGGGVIGRIRGSSLGELSNVVYTGSVTSEGGVGAAIASGDSGADAGENVYFIIDKGASHNGLGKPLTADRMAGGAAKLSDAWTVSSDMYPLPTFMLYKGFNVFDIAPVVFAAGENEKSVKSDFTLPESVYGKTIAWSSDNEAVVKITGANADVTRPDGGAKNVVITGDVGVGKTTLTVHVEMADPPVTEPTPENPSDTNKPDTPAQPTGEPDPSGSFRFITGYAEAGKPIVLGGYGSASSFTWTITNQATGASRTEKTTEPSLTLTENDYESVISVSAGGDEISMYFSYLPVMYITSKTRYRSAGYQYYDADMRLEAGGAMANHLYNGGVSLRLRGNSTAQLQKKPFKLKLDKKSNLLGIDSEGQSKHWVLLANARDPSLLRNKVLMDFSGAIGTDVYMSSESIVLIYNGDYCGVYQLCEHIRVSDTRVDVFDWEAYAEDAAKAIAKTLVTNDDTGNKSSRIADEIEGQLLNDWSWLKTGRVTYNGKSYKFTDLGLPALPKQTGGFLLEMDFYHLGNWYEVASVQTAYAQPLYFNTPEPQGEQSLGSFYETDLYNYASSYIQSFEYALHSDDFVFRNSDDHYYAENYWDKWAPRVYQKTNYTDNANDGKHYSELFDMDSLVQNFIFCEVAMNWDSMKNSMFVYKDVDELAKIGPQWDFDWAWGNETWTIAFGAQTWEPEKWHTTCVEFMGEQYYQEVQWNCLLIRDPYFLACVYDAWKSMRDDQIEKLVGKGGTIDTYAEYLRRAAAANDAKWSRSDAFGIDFDTSVSKLKEFVKTRMAWLDRQFASLDTFVKSLGVYSPSDSISVKAEVGGDKTTITVTVKDSRAKYVNIQINGTYMKEVAVENGKATLTVNNSELDAGGVNCATAFARNSSHKYIIDEAHSITGNYNQVESNFTTFKLK